VAVHLDLNMTVLGKEIHRVYDPDGPIQIFDDGVCRHLSFGTQDEQGCILKAKPSQLQYAYSKAMMLGVLFQPEPTRCLLLGLGAGALTHALYAHCPQTELVVVEWRAQVIRLAYRYLQLPRDKRLQVLQSDAHAYLQRTDNPRFDLVMSDIYSSAGMDQRQQQQDYIAACKRHLTPQGWLVLNFWDEHRNPDLIGRLQQAFQQVWAARISTGNWVVYATQQSAQPSAQPTAHPAPQPTKDAMKAVSEKLGFSLSKVLPQLVCLTQDDATQR
jgi:spermidine synthase